MKIVARGMVSPWYMGYGRMWPRHAQVEVDVTEHEFEQIAKDQNIVFVIVPSQQQQQHEKQSPRKGS